MNESDNLLILSLSQAGFLPEDLNIKSLSQLTNEQFGNIIVKIGKKIKLIKGTEINLPDVYARDLNSKYKDAQLLAEFLKKIGYRSDVNINNILFPSQRDLQRVLEFLIEYLTNSDSNTLEINQNFSEKNFVKMKVSQKFLNWAKESWVLPEIEQELKSNSNNTLGSHKKCIKYEESKIQNFKKKIKDINLSNIVTTTSGKKSKELVENDDIKIYTEEDYKIIGSIKIPEEANMYLFKKLQRSMKNTFQNKSSAKQFIDFITKRTEVIDQINRHFCENNFENNVNILKIKNYNIKLTNLINQKNQKEKGEKYEEKSNTESKISSILSKNQNKENETNEIEQESNKMQYQRKIDQIIANIEKEKEEISLQINEKNNILQSIILAIEEHEGNSGEIRKKKDESENILKEITLNNQNILKQIEEKLETFEQIQKMNRAEIKEDDILGEVNTLEKKFEEMISNWEEYTAQANSKIDELKNNLESKKKEYNFKYEKANLLKKEIEEISSKINVKEELANFLKDEYQKIPVDINRNKFITKITELTHNINNQKNNISIYLNELKTTDNQIVMINDSIKKVDNEFEDKLFQDAKKDANSKEFYALFIKIRDGYNLIQKNIIDLNIAKTKMKELENRVDDYQLKLKSYDINQLTEQVELLRRENSVKFRK